MSDKVVLAVSFVSVIISVASVVISIITLRMQK